MSSIFSRKETFGSKIRDLFKGKFDESTYDELMETMLLSDVSYETSEKILENVKDHLKKKQYEDTEAVKEALRESIMEVVGTGKFEFKFPSIVLFYGVNGVGKTTTVAKIANKLKNEGKSVLLCAADTFRAAACEQLSMWADKLHINIVKSTLGQDPAGVVFDAISSAKAKNVDVVLVDTAGRLQSKDNLMAELNKIHRVADKNREQFELFNVMVIDGTNGNNALVQFNEFSDEVKADAMVVTKFDSSSKCGTIISITDKFSCPVWYLGTGEAIEDIEEFDPDEYAKTIV